MATVSHLWHHAVQNNPLKFLKSDHDGVITIYCHHRNSIPHDLQSDLCDILSLQQPSFLAFPAATDSATKYRHGVTTEDFNQLCEAKLVICQWLFSSRLQTDKLTNCASSLDTQCNNMSPVSGNTPLPLLLVSSRTLHRHPWSNACSVLQQFQKN